VLTKDGVVLANCYRCGVIMLKCIFWVKHKIKCF